MDNDFTLTLLGVLGTLGGFAGLSSLIGMLLYVRQERRRRVAESRKIEAETTQMIESMALELVKAFEVKYQELRHLYEEQSRDFSRLRVRLQQVIQVVRSHVEVRLAHPEDPGLEDEKVLLDQVTRILEDSSSQT